LKVTLSPALPKMYHVKVT